MRRKPRTPEEKAHYETMERFWKEVGSERWTTPVDMVVENSLDLAAHEFGLTPEEAKDSDDREEIENIAIVRMEEELENLAKVIEYLRDKDTKLLWTTRIARGY